MQVLEEEELLKELQKQAYPDKKAARKKK